MTPRPSWNVPSTPQTLYLEGGKAIAAVMNWAARQPNITLLEWAKPGNALLHRILIKHLTAKPTLLRPPLPPLVPPLDEKTLAERLKCSVSALQEARKILVTNSYQKIGNLPPEERNLLLFLIHPDNQRLLQAFINREKAWHQLPPISPMHLLLSPNLTRWWSWTLAVAELVLEAQGRSPQTHQPVVARRASSVWIIWEGPLQNLTLSKPSPHIPKWLQPLPRPQTSFPYKPLTYNLEVLL